MLDEEACYRAVRGRDRRFDGVFYTGVRTTGIYCRPSCPAVTPKRGNVAFYRSAAEAQGAGFRACRRCLPDATPGSPEWDVAADAAGRAMRLIADGVVDRDGVAGLAAAVGYSVRQLNRLLVQECGAGPLALARSRRAQTARVLVETTDLSLADIAFTAGFSSVRQFNDTIREVYAATPSQLRGRRGEGASSGTIRVRVAVREPYDAASLLGFLATRAIPGVEATGPDWYERALSLPHGPGVVRVELGDRPRGAVPARFTLADARDLAPALERTRRLLDADCDPLAVDEALAGDPALRPLVEARSGLRVPGHVDGHEVAVRAVLGQQVSVPAARTTAARLASRHGEALVLAGDHVVDRLFPAAEVLAGLGPDELPMPASRARALTGLCAALADGEIRLDRGGDRAGVRARLLALPGIGPWTADYIALRALGDPDVFLPTDLGVRRAAESLGIDPRTAQEAAQRWRPWRSYALIHLWTAPAATDRPSTREDHLQ